MNLNSEIVFNPYIQFGVWETLRRFNSLKHTKHFSITLILHDICWFYVNSLYKMPTRSNILHANAALCFKIWINAIYFRTQTDNLQYKPITFFFSYYFSYRKIQSDNWKMHAYIQNSRFLFVTYIIIQNITSSENVSQVGSMDSAIICITNTREYK